VSLDRALRIQALCTRLESSAHVPPAHDSLAVVIAGAVCGSARPEVAHALADAGLGFHVDAGHLVLNEEGLTFESRTAVMNEAALWLRDHGWVKGWRNELLAVVADVKQPPVARIERAACRALGLTTFAVHLNAWSGTNLWLARRASHKAIDAGLWDTLVGGMVTANESERVALDREAFEEAGLALGRHNPQPFRRVHMWRPVPEGYQSEVIRAFDVELPRDVQPVNHDGEVDRIERRSVDSVLDAIDAGELTLEAALITLESLTRRLGLELSRKLFIG
jgi:8-oxo-dGTP pyrophosphatase MutT (NUDIX family)